MAVINKSWLRRAVILTLFGISGVALLGSRTVFLNTTNNSLKQAKENWYTQAIKHYRLTLNYANYQNCQQELEIKNEKVIAIHQDTCSSIPTRTIPELFKQIEIFTNDYKCGPNGCACDGPMAVNTIYDPQYGYPRHIEIKLQPEKRWLYYDSLSDIYPGRLCTMIGFLNQNISVSSFQAMQ